MSPKRVRQGIRTVLYLLPTFLFLFAFTYLPAITSFVASFFSTAGSASSYVGLENYVSVFTTPLFWRVVANNLFYTAVSVPITILLALALALLMNRRLSGTTVLRTAFFYPMIIPYVAAAMIWLYILTPTYGILDRILIALRLPNVNWVADQRYAMWSIIIVGVWKNAGYYMIIFLTGLQQVPTSLIESAYLDGASPARRFWQITLPLISPTSFFILVVSVIGSFQAVDQVYLMTSGGPGNATNLIVYYIYQNAFVFWNSSYASTLTAILVAVLLALTLILFKVIEPRVYYESAGN